MVSIEEQKLSIAFVQFSINANQLYQENAVPIIKRNPIEDLMKRYKHKHLTFDQKMYVYKRIKEGEEISHISNRIGIALSTAKKIIRTIQAYPSKNKIFTSIRCKKEYISKQ